MTELDDEDATNLKQRLESKKHIGEEKQQRSMMRVRALSVRRKSPGFRRFASDIISSPEHSCSSMEQRKNLKHSEVDELLPGENLKKGSDQFKSFKLQKTSTYNQEQQSGNVLTARPRQKQYKKQLERTNSMTKRETQQQAIKFLRKFGAKLRRKDFKASAKSEDELSMIKPPSGCYQQKKVNLSPIQHREQLTPTIRGQEAAFVEIYQEVMSNVFTQSKEKMEKFVQLQKQEEAKNMMDRMQITTNKPAFALFPCPITSPLEEIEEEVSPIHKGFVENHNAPITELKKEEDDAEILESLDEILKGINDRSYVKKNTPNQNGKKLRKKKKKRDLEEQKIQVSALDIEDVQRKRTLEFQSLPLDHLWYMNKTMDSLLTSLDYTDLSQKKRKGSKGSKDSAVKKHKRAPRPVRSMTMDEISKIHRSQEYSSTTGSSFREKLGKGVAAID